MQLLSSLRRPAVLLLALAALIGAALPAAATLPPSEARLVASNSTALSFSVGIPVDSDATSMRVLVQTAVDGNATTSTFPLTLPGPVVVDIANLLPNNGYVIQFYLESAGNGSSEATKTTPQLISTLNVGPQIVSFFAADPSADSSNADDDGFSNGDTFTIAFDADTNTPAANNKAEIDAIFRFEDGNMGAAYSGAWINARTLVVTVNDMGDSTPALGSMFVHVIGNLIQRDGKSDVSRSSSPPLAGSFGAVPFRYFVPINEDGARVDATDYAAYTVTSEQDKARRVPLDLVFPDGARQTGYGLWAQIVSPQFVPGFRLEGNNFTTTTSDSVQEGSPTGAAQQTIFTNQQLQTALQGLSIVPPAGFVGFASVSVSLMDRSANSGAAPLQTVYTNIRFTAPKSLDIPSLTVNGEKSGLLEDPVGTIKTYKTPLIAALCSVLGFFILLGLGICLWKKYRGGRDARDFEGQPLASDEPNADRAALNAGGDGAATRRFYYDAKV